MSDLLRKDQIQDALDTLPGWKEHHGAIHKEFLFDDFKQALEMMNQIGAKAEEMNHHPEWTNIYNKLTVHLSTHDAGGITKKDVELAKSIEQLVAQEALK